MKRKTNRGFNFNFEIPVEIGDGEMIVNVEVSEYWPGTPAQIRSRPEDSYPAEGSDFSDIKLSLVTFSHHREEGKTRTERKHTELPAEFYGVFVSAMGGDDSWHEMIDMEAGEAMDIHRDEEAQRRYDDMIDREYEEMRERRFD